MDLVLRFILGGLIVSLFAILAGALRPKGFAGLFAAAPSVALATLSLTVLDKGKDYAALEARSMMVGAFAFFLYALGCVYFMAKKRFRAAPTTLAMLLVWGILAFGLKPFLLK